MAGGTRLVDTQLTNRGVEAGESPSASACDTRIIALTIQYFRRESTRPRSCLQSDDGWRNSTSGHTRGVEAGELPSASACDTRIIALTIQYFRRESTRPRCCLQC
ncbi:hypothetical protein J6590_064248 [Homalodisca vitripennis]|nr:hypothetical protein J6590_064248 [Homalodisca vitripennis]